MKRIGMFLDVENLYFYLMRKYGKKLDYRKLLEFVDDFGETNQRIAYGYQTNDEAIGFTHFLQNMGFKTKFKCQNSWNVGIAVDIMTLADRLDRIILCTADADLEPVVDWATSKGLDVVVMACGISKALRLTATQIIEIPESLLCSS